MKTRFSVLYLTAFASALGQNFNQNVWINGAPGAFRTIEFTSSNVRRFNVGTDAAAENGGNAGTNFQINRFDDGGNFLGVSLFINRQTGNVGIGTSNPKATFSVGLNNDDELNFYAIGDNQLAIQTSLDGQPIGSYGGGNNALFLQPIVGNVLLVAGGGNVGIGTTNPGSKLTVVSDQPNPYNGALTIFGDYTAAESRAGQLMIKSRTDDAKRLYLGIHTSGDYGSLEYVHDGVNAGPLILQAFGGRVGIGMTNPQAGLDVANGIHVHGGASYATTGAGLELLKISDSLGTIAMINAPDRTERELRFYGTPLSFYQGATERMRIADTGNVGIGTTNPTQKLSVNGTIRAKEVIVDSGWSDYVFASDYRLAPLSEVERHIKTEGHLPGIPSAADVAEHGVTVGEMQAKLLAKIEELTLHVIEQEKAISGLRVQNDALQREVREMKAANAAR